MGDDLISKSALLETIVNNCYPIVTLNNSVESGMTVTGIRQAIDEQKGISVFDKVIERLEERKKYLLKDFVLADKVEKVSDTEKLLPCPFCGREGKIVKGEDSLYDTKIECIDCGCGTKIFNEYFNVREYAIEQMRLGNVDNVCGIILDASIKKAIQAWNKRI